MRSRLAHVEKIRDITSIPNADKIELAHVLGWQVVVQKGQFNVGDLVVYIEIDSVVDVSRPEFAFLKDRGRRIKTIKLRGEVSQGLIIPLTSYGEGYDKLKEGEDVTKHFGLVHYEEILRQEEEEKERQRLTPFQKFVSKHCRWLGYLLGILPKSSPRWPDWIKKTDEERIQNIPDILVTEKDSVFDMTEKIDGCSSTYSLYKGKYYICSRNKVLSEVADANTVWVKNYHKYDLKHALKEISKIYQAKEVTIQGESIASNVQGNKYLLVPNASYLFIFSITVDQRRLGDKEMISVIDRLNHNRDKQPNLLTVPYLGECSLRMFENVEDCLSYADGETSAFKYIDLLDFNKASYPTSAMVGRLREGIVFRKVDGTTSFKAVSNKFLLKNKE